MPPGTSQYARCQPAAPRAARLAARSAATSRTKREVDGEGDARAAAAAGLTRDVIRRRGVAKIVRIHAESETAPADRTSTLELGHREEHALPEQSARGPPSRPSTRTRRSRSPYSQPACSRRDRYGLAGWAYTRRRTSARKSASRSRVATLQDRPGLGRADGGSEETRKPGDEPRAEGRVRRPAGRPEGRQGATPPGPRPRAGAGSSPRPSREALAVPRAAPARPATPEP